MPEQAVPELNRDLLYRALDTVLAMDMIGRVDMTRWTARPPSRYDSEDGRNAERYAKQQAADICATTACFAGWALMLDGGRSIGTFSIELPDGEVIDQDDIETRARERLGLTREEAHALFYAPDDIAEVKARVDKIAAGDYRW